MSRILLAWELGYNLGHLSRLRPLARRLRERGHTVLVAARDLTGAARALAPAGIPFIQAPQAALESRADQILASYADMLLHQGWGESSQLVGILHAWINLLRMFSPDAVVLDHSPTAALAARSLGIRSAWIGTGFEIPPLKVPLPAFPAIPTDRAAQAESKALDTANRVLQAMRLPRLNALKDLFADSKRWLATYEELDHYGSRAGEEYVGVFNEIGYGKAVEWAGQGNRHVFAYLRPQTPGFETVLKALSISSAEVICYAPGVAPNAMASLARPGFVLSPEPVRVDTLLNHADLCVSYAPAGTVATTLLRGVPQLCAPPHVEAKLTAGRIESMGAGLAVKGRQTESGIDETIRRMLDVGTCAAAAKKFAERYKDTDRKAAVDRIACGIEAL